MKTGNTYLTYIGAWTIIGPQWSPVMKTGNTGNYIVHPSSQKTPQWSPVMKTGNTSELGDHARQLLDASMEPGHEDREYW